MNAHVASNLLTQISSTFPSDFPWSFVKKLSVILEAKQLCKMNLVVLTLKSSRTQKGLSSNLQSIIFFQRTLKGYECMSLFGSPPFMKDFWDTPQPASVNMAHLLPWKRSLILNHRMSLVLSPPVRSSLGNSPSMVLDRCEAPLLASCYFASCYGFFQKGIALAKASFSTTEMLWEEVVSLNPWSCFCQALWCPRVPFYQEPNYFSFHHGGWRPAESTAPCSKRILKVWAADSCISTKCRVERAAESLWCKAWHDLSTPEN